MTRTTVLNETVEAFDGTIRGLPYPKDRAPQAQGGVRLPANTTVVSVDSHWTIHDDIFYENFPAHLKERAPRLTIGEGGNHNWLLNGQTPYTEAVQRSNASYESLPGCYSIEPRLRNMDAEGIQKEIVFPNGGLPEYFGMPDVEAREWIFKIYNQHMAQMQTAAPGRFYGAGAVNFWDMERVRDSVQEVARLGLKCAYLPQNPKGPDGVELNYCDPAMDPLFAAIAEVDLPITFHVGEFFRAGPGGHGTTVMVNFGPFRKNFGEMVFGGIFDRHPTLQVVFCEGEMNWIPGALQTATMCYEGFYDMIEPKIKRHPREYWQDNMHVTFMHDPAGLRLLDIIGADRVMWSSDYPHIESTWGFSWTAMQGVLDAAKSDDDARAMLGGNAMRLFKL